MADKPSLAIVIAKSKAASKGAAGAPDEKDSAEPEASDECESCARKFFEAGQDGDWASASMALKAFLQHAEAGEGEAEEG